MNWDGEGEPTLAPYKMPILASAMPVFFLGHFFKCAPSSWDDLPPERVVLDYYILSAFKELEAKQMEELKRENTVGGAKGKAVRTTSDSDFFERMNSKLGGE
jgi:hypothetical protein